MNQIKSLISVIVTVYNVEDYLHKCINSIIGQTHKNLEIILINDGSTDNSKQICESYLDKDKRIKLINKSNGGVSSARNLGLDEASGDCIIFVDSDDYIHKDMYKDMFSVMTAEQVDMVICGHFMVYEDKTIPIRNDHRTIIYSREEALRKILLDVEINSYPVDKLCKRALYDGFRYPLGRVFEDTATQFRTIAKAQKIAQLNIPYYYYFNKTSSITRSKSFKGDYDNFLAFYDRFDFAYLNFSELTVDCAQMALQQGINVIDAYAISDKKQFLKEYYQDCKGKILDILKTLNNTRKIKGSLNYKLRLFATHSLMYLITYKVFHSIKSILK